MIEVYRDGGTLSIKTHISYEVIDKYTFDYKKCKELCIDIKNKYPGTFYVGHPENGWCIDEEVSEIQRIINKAKKSIIADIGNLSKIEAALEKIPPIFR